MTLDLPKGQAMAKSSWQRILVRTVGAPVVVAAMLVAVWVSPASAHQPARADVPTSARPHVARLRTTSGQHGYWLVGSDGGVFSFGSAQFFGSAANLHLQSPVVGIAPTPGRGGYWLVASDGGVFSFGDANFYGSIPGLGRLSLLSPRGRGEKTASSGAGRHAANLGGTGPTIIQANRVFDPVSDLEVQEIDLEDFQVEKEHVRPRPIGSDEAEPVLERLNHAGFHTPVPGTTTFAGRAAGEEKPNSLRGTKMPVMSGSFWRADRRSGRAS